MSIRWKPVITRAADIVRSYDTPVTLRQLFYRLVAAELIPNTRYAYQRLSKLTAEGRRDGSFPDLHDPGRAIHRNKSFASPKDAVDWVSRIYRRDRTEGQAWTVYIGVEKAGLVAQLDAWFGDPRGIPILALSGYASQSYVDSIVRDVAYQGRPAALLYAGDFDPSGEDIFRDFVARTDCWTEVRHVALSATQVDDFGLPPQLGKATDSRASAFMAKHGTLVQVELDALAPPDLRALYADALWEFWGLGVAEKVRVRERRERNKLTRVTI